jgi:hypothetical protein
MAWNTDSNANRLIKSYVQDFIDISGSMILRDKSNLYVNGNTTVNGNLFLNNASILTDLSFNKKIFVGGDCSLNGKLTSVGDISINGNITRCIFNNSSIPQNAFNGTISVPGPDYTKSSVFYEQKFKADADISLNGNTVQVNRININGNIKFSNDSSLNKYDDNMLKTDLSSSYISSVCFTKPPNFASDLNFIHTKSSASGKIIAIAAGGNGYTVGQYAPSSNNPTGDWANYSRFGVYISRDFGNTWTKYLMPYEDETKLGFSYQDMAMSSDGKHILITVLPNGNNPNGLPAAIAFSHDYGYTWSSTRYPCYGGAPGTPIRPSTCCMSDDGRRMLVANGGQNSIWYGSNDYGVSWITVNSSTTGLTSTLMYEFGAKLFCNADLTKLFISKNYSVIMYVITLNENLAQVSFIEFNGSLVHGTLPARTGTTSIQKICMPVDGKNILILWGYGGNNLQNTYLEFYNSITNTWRTVTPTYIPGSVYANYTTYLGFSQAFMSRSGQYIITYGMTYHPNPDYTTVYLISTDYGYTFNHVITPVVPIYDIYDDGSFLSISGQIINLFKPNIYKASTFTSLNLTGNLTAGSLTSSSDYRIKTDIAALDETFTIDNLRPVKYLQTLINKTRYGVIAHELQLYYPDLVVGEKDGEDLQYVNYTGLIAILINEIKRLKQEVLELENEV